MAIHSLENFVTKAPDADLILFLIKEELKNNKLFTGLYMAGLDDCCCYRSYFGDKVLQYAGFGSDNEDLIERYNRLLEKYTERIEPDDEVISKCARDLYKELTLEA